MPIAFVQNYQDLSTDRGYQFKFNCDHCGNGYMTSFQPSVAGMAGSVLRAAGDIFGGMFASAGAGAFEVQRAIGGPAHDSALEAAVNECKGQFHQCTRCGKWVCPEVCWNGPAAMCKGCAPRFEEEVAAGQANAKANAARDQLNARAAQVDYVSGIDMRGVVSAAPQVQAGTPHAAEGTHCTGCGAMLGTSKFCQECGTPRPVAAPTACKCGATLTPGIKFCGECGEKVAH